MKISRNDVKEFFLLITFIVICLFPIFVYLYYSTAQELEDVREKYEILRKSDLLKAIELGNDLYKYVYDNSHRNDYGDDDYYGGNLDSKINEFERYRKKAFASYDECEVRKQWLDKLRIEGYISQANICRRRLFTNNLTVEETEDTIDEFEEMRSKACASYEECGIEKYKIYAELYKARLIAAQSSVKELKMAADVETFEAALESIKYWKRKANATFVHCGISLKQVDALKDDLIRKLNKEKMKKIKKEYLESVGRRTKSGLLN